MLVRVFIGVLLLAQLNSKCVKNKIKLWSPTNCEAGMSFFARIRTIETSDHKIVQPYLFPWLVEVRIAFPRQEKSCTGVLINDRYVLTTQRCTLPSVQPAHITVHLGFYNGYKKEISEFFQSRVLERKVQQIIQHPQYNPQDPKTAVNDLALLKLTKPVKYSKTIYPIQLPSPANKLLNYTNQVATYVEWSFLPNNQTSNARDRKTLKEATVKMLDTEQCGNFNPYYKQIITPEVVCSLTIKPNIQTCEEENGGLLTVERKQRLHNITVLVGISARSSVVKPCPEIESPGVYVRIDKKLDWIKTNTQDGLYCRY